MILIAHRGNVSGPQPERENTPEYIEEALSKGFDVEIDVRCEDGKILLGHDNGETNITLDWIQGHGDRLWVHCKNLEALRFFSSLEGVNFFWHQEDDFTLTSKKIIWTYPRKKVTDKSIIVCFTKEEAEFYIDNYPLLGVCCDWVEDLK